MISIVIPCFNEGKNIDALHQQLTSVMEKAKEKYEIIFVDDGSVDDSLSELRRVQSLDSNVRVLEFSKNFGHQAALGAGMNYTKGDAVITMDADLQHPPELIPELIRQWRDGYDIVYTVRRDTAGTPLFKKFTAKFFYALINMLGNINLPENSADFRLLDRKVVDQFKKLGETTKFWRGLVCWVGFRQYGLYYDAAPRFAGKTKYSLNKMIRFAFDGIASFSSFPLHISTILGLCISFFCFLYALYAIYAKVVSKIAIQGWTSVMVAVLFLGGVQLLCLGVIGEYLNRIYMETKKRPEYIVRNVYENGQP